jgi:hypothetical protein
MVESDLALARRERALREAGTLPEPPDAAAVATPDARRQQP